MKRLGLMFALLAATLTPPLQAAELGITPVAVQLARATDRSAVSVVNRGAETVTMQAEVIAWKRVNGVDQDVPTDDMMLNPSVFVVAPGQTQILRLGLRRGADYKEEATYRLVLREVPTEGSVGSTMPGTNVRVLVALRIPVYVAPDKVVQEEKWAARRDKDGTIVASVKNAGNVHYKIGNVFLRGANATDGESMAQAIVGSVLFPGEEKSFQLKPQKPYTARQAMIEVATDRGQQYVPLDIASD